MNIYIIKKNVFVYKKLLAFVFQELGYSLKVIQNIIGVTHETLLAWNNQWETKEYDSLLRKKGQRRKSKLTDEK